MTNVHVLICFVIFISITSSARVFLLRSPLVSPNSTIGSQSICPRILQYPQHCVIAMDTIYSYQDGGNVTDSLQLFCSQECLQPLEYYWREVVYDTTMSVYVRSILCQKTNQRGYCTQQFIQSTSEEDQLTGKVDEECITKWCPLVCKPLMKQDKYSDYIKCCSHVLIGHQETFAQVNTDSDLYGLTTKSINMRQYDYCAQLLMRFQNDGNCLNIVELIQYITKLVHHEDYLINNAANRGILARGLQEYCESDCIQIISSYYTACSSVNEAIHQLFLYKALYCAKDKKDYCLVKGLEKMESGNVNKYKFRIYCVAPEFTCPRQTCKDTINEAKNALGCCCQNLFNIEGSPFRDLIPNFIMRFLECQIEVPKMCTGCSRLTTSLASIMTMLTVVVITNKILTFI